MVPILGESIDDVSYFPYEWSVRFKNAVIDFLKSKCWFKKTGWQTSDIDMLIPHQEIFEFNLFKKSLV